MEETACLILPHNSAFGDDGFGLWGWKMKKERTSQTPVH